MSLRDKTRHNCKTCDTGELTRGHCIDIDGNFWHNCRATRDVERDDKIHSMRAIPYYGPADHAAGVEPEEAAAGQTAYERMIYGD